MPRRSQSERPRPQRLADRAGGAAFTLDELGEAGAALRTAADLGPERRVGTQLAVRPLAPLFVGLALVAALLAVRPRLRRGRV